MVIEVREMTSMQRQQVDDLERYGWEVVLEKEGYVELIHITLPNGAFAVAHVYPYGSYSWEGSYPLARLSTKYPFYDYTAGE